VNLERLLQGALFVPGQIAYALQLLQGASSAADHYRRWAETFYRVHHHQLISIGDGLHPVTGYVIKTCAV
jgi:hypothetical protein